MLISLDASIESDMESEYESESEWFVDGHMPWVEVLPGIGIGVAEVDASGKEGILKGWE